MPFFPRMSAGVKRPHLPFFSGKAQALSLVFYKKFGRLDEERQPFHDADSIVQITREVYIIDSGSAS